MRDGASVIEKRRKLSHPRRRIWIECKGKSSSVDPHEINSVKPFSQSFSMLKVDRPVQRVALHIGLVIAADAGCRDVFHEPQRYDAALECAGE
jgi:hypothetical protein